MLEDERDQAGDRGCGQHADRQGQHPSGGEPEDEAQDNERDQTADPAEPPVGLGARVVADLVDLALQVVHVALEGVVSLQGRGLGRLTVGVLGQERSELLHGLVGCCLGHCRDVHWFRHGGRRWGGRGETGRELLGQRLGDVLGAGRLRLLRRVADHGHETLEHRSDLAELLLGVVLGVFGDRLRFLDRLVHGDDSLALGGALGRLLSGRCGLAVRDRERLDGRPDVGRDSGLDTGGRTLGCSDGSLGAVESLGGIFEGAVESLDGGVGLRGRDGLNGLGHGFSLGDGRLTCRDVNLHSTQRMVFRLFAWAMALDSKMAIFCHLTAQSHTKLPRSTYL